MYPGEGFKREIHANQTEKSKNKFIHNIRVSHLIYSVFFCCLQD
jgi:hypothetical protein